MSKPITRPTECTDDVLKFLDDLRSSGVTNMFGAWQYLESEFMFDRDEASSALSYWMATFGDRGNPEGAKQYTFGQPTTNLNISVRRRVKNA